MPKIYDKFYEQNRKTARTNLTLEKQLEHQEDIHKKQSTDARAAQRELKKKLETTVETLVKMRERETAIEELASRIKGIEDLKEVGSKLRENLKYLDEESENRRKQLDTQNENLLAIYEGLKMKEKKINNLEQKLENECLFGSHLAEFINEAKRHVEELIDRALIKAPGSPLPGNVLVDMRTLFARSTKFICDRK